MKSKIQYLDNISIVFNNTLLCYAIKNRRIEAVELLLSRKEIDINEKSIYIKIFNDILKCFLCSFQLFYFIK